MCVHTWHVSYVIVCLQLHVGTDAFTRVCDSAGFISTCDDSQRCSSDMSQHSVLRQTM